MFLFWAGGFTGFGLVRWCYIAVYCVYVACELVVLLVLVDCDFV